MDACRGSLTYARDAVGRGRVSAARVSPHLSVSAARGHFAVRFVGAARTSGERRGSCAPQAHHYSRAVLYSSRVANRKRVERSTASESHAGRSSGWARRCRAAVRPRLPGRSPAGRGPCARASRKWMVPAGGAAALPRHRGRRRQSRARRRLLQLDRRSAGRGGNFLP